jgi:transcriptional regulator with XRE-family HTH domain
MDMTLFATHLRDLRTSHGMSVQTLADAAGVTVSDYHAWEDGAARPSAEQMLRIAAALGIPAEDIIYGGMTMMPPADDTTAEQRRAEYEAYAEEQERRYRRGKRYVTAIIIMEAIGSLLSFLLMPSGASLISGILAAVVLVCLWNGKVWAKWVMVVLSGLNALAALFSLLAANPFAILTLAYSIAVCVLLLANESVSDFLSYQDS